MQKLCFKKRKGARTVQLVRHKYCSVIKRSRTTTLASFPIDADPEDFRPDLKLGAGVELAEGELQQVADWLRRHGDPKAMERRQAAKIRLEAKVREVLRAEQGRGDSIDEALYALAAASREIVDIAKRIREEGGDVWKCLRPRYLELFGSWEQFQRAAQEAGIMKRVARGGASGSEDI